MMPINPPDDCLVSDPACTIEDLCPACLDGIECAHADCGYGECSGRWMGTMCETHHNGEGRCQRGACSCARSRMEDCPQHGIAAFNARQSEFYRNNPR